MAENAARAAELGTPGVDLNFGCPAKTVNRSDGGAILLREPERVHRIVAAARNAIPGEIPLTVKTRLGFEDDSLFMDIVRGIEAAGATELIVHARTRKQGYRPPAHWEQIALAREAVSLPVTANGEIWSVEDARRARAISGCDSLMLGRGALCRPDLPGLIAADAAGVDREPMPWRDVAQLVRTYFALNLHAYDARYVGNPIKQWLVYLRGYYLEAAMLFENIKRHKEPQSIQAALDAAASPVARTPNAA